MGRPAHAPEPFHRRQVEAMAGYGIPEIDIARVLGIDPKTLRKHYREELDTGHVIANAKVAESLFRKATGEGPQSVAAAIFWMKARAGWREKHELVVSTRPVQELSDEELTEIIQQGRDRRAIEADPGEP